MMHVALSLIVLVQLVLGVLNMQSANRVAFKSSVLSRSLNLSFQFQFFFLCRVSFSRDSALRVLAPPEGLWPLVCLHAESGRSWSTYIEDHLRSVALLRIAL